LSISKTTLEIIFQNNHVITLTGNTKKCVVISLNDHILLHIFMLIFVVSKN